MSISTRRTRVRRFLIAGVLAGATLPATASASAPLAIDGSLTVNGGIAAYQVTNLPSSETHVTTIDLRSPQPIEEVTSSQGECEAEGLRAFCHVDLAPGRTMTIYAHGEAFSPGHVHDLCAQSLEPRAEDCLTLTARPPQQAHPTPPAHDPHPTEPTPTTPPTTPPANAPAEQPKQPEPTTPMQPPVVTSTGGTQNGTGVTDVPGIDCHCVDLFARVTRTDPVGNNVQSGRGVVGMDVNWRMRCSGGPKFRTCKGKLKFSLPGHPNASATIAPYSKKRVRKPVYRTKNGVRVKNAQGRFIIDRWKRVVEDVRGRAAATQQISCETKCGGTITGKSYVRFVIPNVGPANAAGGRTLDVKVVRDCPGTPLADQDLKLVFNAWGDLQKKKSTLS